MKKKYYFLGVGGVAMASLAVLLKEQGHIVGGSDNQIYPPMSDYLAFHNITCFNGYNANNLDQFRPDVVIVGNVISRGNVEIEKVLCDRIAFVSLPQFLKEHCLQNARPLVIAGTHGKTTTTSLLAHILESAGLAPGYFIGGKPNNFDHSARSARKDGYFVIEGDEYDTAFFDKRAKFFHYQPHYFLVNNLEFDHGDIYADLNQIIQTFRYALRLVPKNGYVFINGDSPSAKGLIPFAFSPVVTFGWGAENDIRIENFVPSANTFESSFCLHFANSQQKFVLPLPGSFNVGNATAAIVMAHFAGVPFAAIQQALTSFYTTDRRLQVKTQQKKVIVIDDFAHHPSAIASGLQAIKEHYPDYRLQVAYEPKSNTSIRKFHQETMAKAFSCANEVHFHQSAKFDLIPVHDRLDMQQIVHELNTAGILAKVYPNTEEIFTALQQHTTENTILCVMSQGSFQLLAKNLAQHFDKLYTETGFKEVKNS